MAEDADHDSTDGLFNDETHDTVTLEAGDLNQPPVPDAEASTNETNNDIAVVESTSTRLPGTETPTMQYSIITNTAPPDHETPVVEEDAADSDRGSLLSHDPEDDDAEPDWLESD